MPGQESAHDPADIRRHEAFLLHFHVLSLPQSGDDAGIGGGTADAVLFQGAHQARLRVTRGRRGKVLIGAQLAQCDTVSLLQRRQRAFFFVLAHRVVLAFLVHRQEAGLAYRGAVGAEKVVALAAEVHRHGVYEGRSHLGGDRSFPDQLVQTPLIPVQQGLQLAVGQALDGGRADRLVGLLGILGAGLVAPRLRRQRFLAVAAGNQAPDVAQRLRGQVHRVGAHVRDQPAPYAVSHIHALVEPLGDPHGVLGGKAEPAGRFLLQRRGNERRGGVPPALLFPHLLHDQFPPGVLEQAAAHLARGFAVRDAELRQFFAAVAGQAAGENTVGMGGVRLDGPVFPGLEAFDLFFALHDHAQGGALHAAGGQSGADLFPKQRG